MNFSLRPESYPLLVTFALYMISYLCTSIYLLRKLGQAIKVRTSSTCIQTVKLVKAMSFLASCCWEVSPYWEMTMHEQP
uniref:G_PROTEIN_RECEP_F1_2 domain-containing protein n=1 Tax=Steinernema glaseri TaxID=37863 RepID=A0A1I8ASQ0_9BILA